MKVAITGGSGFLGWHTAVRLRALYGINPIVVDRSDFADPFRLSGLLNRVDTIIHLAGINRAATDEEVELGNVRIAETLADAIAAGGGSQHVVFGNTVQSGNDNPYGRGKAGAAELLQSSLDAVGGTMADIILPNLFGEHGRPHYNSFIATFCYEVVNGRTPEVTEDKKIELLHAQRAADSLIEAAQRRENDQRSPVGQPWHVSETLALICGFHDVYTEGQIPMLDSPFSVDLFNTYRSYMFPQHFPFMSQVNSDERGALFETVRVHGGKGQTFVSSTVPGAVRGEHYHLRKVERFFILKGTAEVALRRVLDGEIIRFRLTGRDHSFVDMPTMWAHKITNVGDDELLTMFWSDQLLDPEAPDTYREQVEPEGNTHS